MNDENSIRSNKKAILKKIRTSEPNFKNISGEQGSSKIMKDRKFEKENNNRLCDFYGY